MRITLVVYTMEAGGAARVLCIMANYWVEKGYEVNLITFDDGSKILYPLSSLVKCLPLNITRASKSLFDGIFNNLCRLRMLRQALKASKPDCVISFLYTTNIIVLLASLGLSYPVVVSERNDPRQRKEKRTLWHALRRLTYRSANHLVVQNQDIQDYFHKYNTSVPIIPNPIQISEESLKKEPEIELPSGKKLVSMGRLVGQKGFDRLLFAFAKLKDKYPDWKLIIFGEGPLESDLHNLSEILGLEGRVFFPGLLRNPFSVIAKCDLFVLSSRYEGFPNALLEAMACGLSVISYDCQSGPSSIIKHGVNGLLVPEGDISALSKAMEKLMSSYSKRREFGNRAKEVCSKYSVEKIMSQWQQLLTFT